MRLDKAVTIGAVLELRVDDLSLESFFHSYYSGFCAVITTTEGLHALGFDVPYSNLAVTLYENPDAPLGEYLEMSLAGIAARTPGMELASYAAEARENKKTASGLLIAAGAVFLLFFTICASMINNTLSARCER